ncbi:hypothetical protein PUN28_017487 [Cardiocondyla obscurior]|uniref:Uncharacterized protein n=1 Tax=Cardiocondyla obscurior TaxID=286306 RepID=A0AAW2END2_9HYME
MYRRGTIHSTTRGVLISWKTGEHLRLRAILNNVTNGLYVDDSPRLTSPTKGREITPASGLFNTKLTALGLISGLSGTIYARRRARFSNFSLETQYVNSVLQEGGKKKKEKKKNFFLETRERERERE